MSLGRLFEIGRFGFGLQAFLPLGAVPFVVALLLAEPARAQNPDTQFLGKPIPGKLHASGKSHEYRILKQPDSKQTVESVPQPAKPLIVAKPVQPYAYGWFGAKTSMHWHRQFGNRRVHTQWTLK